MSPKEQIKQLRMQLAKLTKSHNSMGQAFRAAFMQMIGQINGIKQAITILSNGNPEILELLQIQPEERANEGSGGDGQSRILSLQGGGTDRGTPGEVQPSEDAAGNEAPESRGGEE